MMNIWFTDELSQESFDAGLTDKQKKKPLVSRHKLSLESFGSLASIMTRIMRLYGHLAAEYGKTVIFPALEQQNVKFRGEMYEAGPALAGKMFPDVMPAFFDLIGRVEPRFEEINDRDVQVYPPKITFDDSDIICKWTGNPDGRKRGKFNIEKIIEQTRVKVDMED